MISFLLFNVVVSILASNVLGLKLIDILQNGDNAQNGNSNNVDSGKIADMIDLIIDDLKEERTSEPTIIPTSSAPTITTLRPTTIDPTTPPTAIPTNFPTLKPINYPFQLPIEPTQASYPTIESDRCSFEVKEYQLKLFWEKGMEWQETTQEWAWCAYCEDDCDSEKTIRLRECDYNDERQSFLFYDCTVRPKRNPDLCFTAAKSRDLSGLIELKSCNDDEKRQKFRMYDPKDAREKFQFKILQPGYEDMCLTQEHHPRKYEELRFYDCRVALENDSEVYDDTSHWLVGSFGGLR